MIRYITALLTLGFWMSGFISYAPPPQTPVYEVRVNEFHPRDSVLFREKREIANRESTLPDKTLAIARSFLGTPYVTGTLEQSGTERVVVNLRQLDCWTLVECSLALARSSDEDLSGYMTQLRDLRYWGGTVNGYGSRIHYFTGWLLQAEKNGILSDLTRSLGGIPYRKQIHYITARPEKYPKIKNPETLRALKAAEKRINAHQWYFIPQQRIRAVEDQLRDGDIVLLCSAKRDLDISHQGFAVRQNGRVHLLHASSLSKKVIISKQPLSQYVQSQRGQTGIMVARLGE
ncbi:MAG: DUF1460 domain-containing protein [Saprospiraceae bacterium]|nr:DUF1460 domain-containing protein [Saprospiraceae bacterium]